MKHHTKIFFNAAYPESTNSLNVRVVRGILDLFREYRKLGMTTPAHQMRHNARRYINVQRNILAKTAF